MKKLANIFLCLALVIISGFGLVGCGDNPPETPPETPPAIVFTEQFGFTTCSAYNEGMDRMSIQDLEQFAKYKSIVLYAKKDTEFNHISFIIKAEVETTDLLKLKFTFNETGITTTSPLEITPTEQGFKVDIYSLKTNTSGDKFFGYREASTFPNVSSNTCSMPKDATFTINISLDHIYDAETEYTTKINFSNFTIE